MAQNYKRCGDNITVVLTSGQTGYASGDGYKIGSQVGVITSLHRAGQTVMI
jgi:predicted RecA/RadA family phage recombinase